MGGRSLLKGPRHFTLRWDKVLADLEPDIFEEERNEIVVYED